MGPSFAWRRVGCTFSVQPHSRSRELNPPNTALSRRIYNVSVPTLARLLIVGLLAASATSALAQPPAGPIRITADLSEAPRKLYHAEIDIPAQPGPLTLITPEWIPGEHRPDGPGFAAWLRDHKY